MHTDTDSEKIHIHNMYVSVSLSLSRNTYKSEYKCVYQEIYIVEPRVPDWRIHTYGKTHTYINILIHYIRIYTFVSICECEIGGYTYMHIYTHVHDTCIHIYIYIGGVPMHTHILHMYMLTVRLAGRQRPQHWSAANCFGGIVSCKET